MKFPYMAWILNDDFEPESVEVHGKSWRGLYVGDGEVFSESLVHASKESAIEYGYLKLSIQQEIADLNQSGINKRRAALEKAAGEAKP